LNFLLANEPALYQNQFNIHGFEWIDLNHRAESVIVYRRKGKKAKDDIVVVLNMTPVVRNDWKLYLDGKESWTEIFNSDQQKYWGTGNTFNPAIPCHLVDKKEKRYELNVHLPPLAAIILK
jgi:1,4-alpha-glucan branching enzyme